MIQIKMGNYIYRPSPPEDPKITNKMLIDVLDTYKQKLKKNDYTFPEFMRILTLYLAHTEALPFDATQFSEEQMMQFCTLGWFVHMNCEVKQTNLDSK